MHHGSAKPAKASTPSRSRKRKYEEIKSSEKPPKPAKRRRIVNESHQHGDGSPSRLEALPSELQCAIFQNLFQSTRDSVQAKSSRSSSALPANSLVNSQAKCTSNLSNVTSILRVSKKTNLEAAHAFYDTVPRPVGALFPVAANVVLQRTLEHRHIIINVQLEFEEDRNCLKNFQKLLNVARHHTVVLRINLGFIDSHGPFDENGLVFKRRDEDMKDLVSELLSWKTPRVTVKMRYTTGCVCGGNRRFPSFKEALAHLSEETTARDIALTCEEGFPRDWPRWKVQNYRHPHWNWIRGRIIRREGVNSV
ncbi:hypothetical protein FKW77_005843 [Venturia effusa]|uniref:F-box domain-containing protein n=1 Tax=Venturia effusa TaxID=50376 RepID=A0A517LCC2_9PEZI|nr:hypothetical protein FKW77_005843 [Venturia effusa]